MPRDGAIIFRDLVGKLEVLNVECDKCGRRGRYRLDRLIVQYGIDAKLFDWEPEADGPRKVAKNEHDPAGRSARTCRRWYNAERGSLAETPGDSIHGARHNAEASQAPPNQMDAGVHHEATPVQHATRGRGRAREGARARGSGVYSAAARGMGGQVLIAPSRNTMIALAILGCPHA